MEKQIQESVEGGGSEGRGARRGEDEKRRKKEEKDWMQIELGQKVPVRVTSREAGRTVSFPGLEAPSRSAITLDGRGYFPVAGSVIRIVVL